MSLRQRMYSIVTLAVTLVLLPSTSALTISSGRPERAARFLQAAGRRLGDEELLQLGDDVSRLPGDQMDKVKQMIQNMIIKHQEAQAGDTDQKAFCNKEMVASKAKVEKNKNEIQKRTADQDLHTAKFAELKDSIGDLHEEVAQSQKGRVKAADLRVKEKSDYEEAKRAREQTMLECKRKMRSEIRAEREAAIKCNEDETLKGVRADNKEEDAQFTMKKLDGELEVAIAKKTKEVELKERKVVSMTHDISLGDGDLKMANEELAASKEYEEKIKATCVNRRDPAKERKAAREKQLSSMKEAYGILTGDDIPR